ncbi:MAG: prolipoprotein diacylglyceryl transferase [Clostridia bacterium]|nr:prolipoprotein diacylglyceryl transferase [Clostridia bacterium]
MIALREDAVKTCFLGVEVYTFGLFVALGLALALVSLALTLRRAQWKKGTDVLTGALAILAGFAVSRLFYGFMDDALGQRMPLWAMLRVNSGGYSMMGAIFGACMGAVLAARLTRQSVSGILDFLAPALMLFIACERLGERYIEDFGVSRILLSDVFSASFLATQDDFGWKLSTYLLESFTALVLSAALLRDLAGKRKNGDTFLLFMLLFGGTQILLESLRYDQHMTVNAYVKYQQVIAMMLLGTAVILLAARAWRSRRGLALAAFLSIPATVGIGVAIEFMIDRTDANRFLLYACFLAAVAVPVWLGLRLRKERNDGKS